MQDFLFLLGINMRWHRGQIPLVIHLEKIIEETNEMIQKFADVQKIATTQTV